jgi:hypothetical protein
VGQRQTLAWSAFRTIREMNPCRFCGYGGRISPTVNTLGTWIQKRAAIELGMTHPPLISQRGVAPFMWGALNRGKKIAGNPDQSRPFEIHLECESRLEIRVA